MAQDTDRQSVFDRAMCYVVALDDRTVLRTEARQRIEKIDIGEAPAFLKVRVDAVLFEEVIKIFREVFQIERIKPFI